jgi:hypothetical protein
MANVIYDFTCSGKTECLEKGGGSRKGRGGSCMDGGRGAPTPTQDTLHESVKTQPPCG